MYIPLERWFQVKQQIRKQTKTSEAAGIAHPQRGLNLEKKKEKKEEKEEERDKEETEQRQRKKGKNRHKIVHAARLIPTFTKSSHLAERSRRK